MLCEQIQVDARLVIEAFEEAGGDELDQVVIALGIFAEQHQVIGALVAGLAGVLRATILRLPRPFIPRGSLRRLDRTVMPAAFRDVNFAADDRLYAACFGLVGEILRGEKIPVVGDGNGGHSPPRRFVRQLLDFAGAVQKTVIRVQMQMDETRGC